MNREMVTVCGLSLIVACATPAAERDPQPRLAIPVETSLPGRGASPTTSSPVQLDAQAAHAQQPAPTPSVSATAGAEATPEERAKALHREADELTASANELTQKATEYDADVLVLIGKKRTITSPPFVPPSSPVRVKFTATVLILNEMRTVSLCDAPYDLTTKFSGSGARGLRMADFVEGVGILSHSGTQLEILSVTSTVRGKECARQSRYTQTLRNRHQHLVETAAIEARAESKRNLELAAKKRKQAAELQKKR